jgi:hypothetical protein
MVPISDGLTSCMRSRRFSAHVSAAISVSLVVAGACSRDSVSDEKGAALKNRVNALIESRLPMLKRASLHLGGERVTDFELAAILADGRVPSLQILDLGNNLISGASVDTIIRSDKTSELTWLVLSNNSIGDQGIAKIAGSNRLRTVTFIGLVAVNATEVGMQALVANELPSLKTIQLGWQSLGDGGARVLTQLSPLEKLDLTRSEIGPDGARTLLGRSQAKHLVLAENPIGAGGLQGLSGLSPRLRTVDLTKTGLAAGDVVVLANLPLDLENLYLAHCDIGDEGLQALARASWLGQLQSLDVGNAGATLPAREQLRKAWGQRSGLTIEHDD